MTAAGPAPGIPGFFEVRDKVRFSVTGADARRFLNGQLTIDVSRLKPDSARQALILTPKGKLCAPIHVWASKNGFVIETEASLRDDFLARMERYIISDDVTLTEDLCPSPVFHLPGGATPAGALAISRVGFPGFDVSARPQGLPELTSLALDLLRISTGTPLWGRELSADTLPQEALLERVAVDFDKGCYVGQEVVSRLKSVGRVNRVLHGFLGALEPAALPLAITTKEASPQNAGILTSTTHDFELAQTLSLGYLNRQFEDFPEVLAVDAAGSAVGELKKRPI